jgi:hypothetical protein
MNMKISNQALKLKSQGMNRREAFHYITLHNDLLGKKKKTYALIVEFSIEFVSKRNKIKLLKKDRDYISALQKVHQLTGMNVSLIAYRKTVQSQMHKAIFPIPLWACMLGHVGGIKITTPKFPLLKKRGFIGPLIMTTKQLKRLENDPNWRKV